MRKKLGYRSWFYFRMGWSTYFAFMFAAVNTMVVTYYLAIESVPVLQEIFPSFLQYMITLSMIGIPLFILIGWVHYRRTDAFGAEAEIQVESNPYHYKALPGWQKEVMFPILQKLTEYMIRTSQNEKFTEKEIQELKNLHEKMDLLIKGGSIGSPRHPFEI